jgi:hypothetical protein
MDERTDDERRLVPLTQPSAHDYDDTVGFEIADLSDATRLARRLQLQAWRVTVHNRDDVHVVTVELRPRPIDLAVLLRVVENWIEEQSLCAIRFELDGRSYLLEAGEADWERVTERRSA